MKKIHILTIVVFLIALNACKKSYDKTETSMVSVNVINASLDVQAIKVNPLAKSISWKSIADQVSYGSNKFYYAPMGATTFKAVAASDTTKLLLNSNLNLTGKVYTLFLLGNSTSMEPMLTEETDFPYIRLDQIKPPSTDSVVNVRFANLSANSPTLKINIQGNTVSETSNLAYKNIGSWRAYDNKASVNYTFEIRNASTNDLILTYSFGARTSNRFRSVTLIIKGIYGTATGVNAFGVSQVNYY